MNEVKRYYGIEAEMQPVEDGPPVDMEWGSHSQYVAASDYDALRVEVEALRADAERYKDELQKRRPHLNYPGDEAAVREIFGSLNIRYCTCGARGDDHHRASCEYWADILTARREWRAKHVVAWSCDGETRGRSKCEQWCGNQKYCPAATRDNISIAIDAARQGGGKP